MPNMMKYACIYVYEATYRSLVHCTVLYTVLWISQALEHMKKNLSIMPIYEKQICSYNTNAKSTCHLRTACVHATESSTAKKKKKNDNIWIYI